MQQWLRDLISFLNGFRKFTIMFLLISLGASFRLASLYTEKAWGVSLLSGAEMVELLRYTAVAFMATNGIEHMSKAVVEWVKNKAKK